MIAATFGSPPPSAPVAAMIAANVALRGVLMEEVGACDGSTLVLRMVETLPSLTVREIAAERGVAEGTIHAACGRAGLPSLLQLRHLILMNRFRRVMALGDVRREHAAWTVGCREPQSFARIVRTRAGMSVSAWLASTTPETVLAEWCARLQQDRAGLRAIHFGMSTARRIRQERLQLEAEVQRREADLVAARARLAALGRRRSA